MTTQPPQMDAAAAKALLDSFSYETMGAPAQSPLRDFDGKCIAIIPRQVTFREGTPEARMALQLTYQFDDVKVLRSAIAYPYKTGSLVFTKPSGEVTTQSTFGIWAQGIDEILTVGSNRPTGSAPIGKVLSVRHTAGHKVRRAGEDGVWKETTIDAYEIVAIDGKHRASSSEGVSSSSVEVTPTVTVDTDIILAELANGKNIGDFTRAALTDARVQADGAVSQLLLGGTTMVEQILRRLVDSGKIVLDESGVYTEVNL